MEEDSESIMSFWTGCETLATVTEDGPGEEKEIINILEIPGIPGIRRLNAKGEEGDESILVENHLMNMDFFSFGVEYEDEYFSSLSGNSWNKEQQCVFCEVDNSFFKTHLLLFL